MKTQKKVKVRKEKLREFEKIAKSNRSAAKRIAALRQKTILSFATPSTRDGVHSSQIIAPNNVVQLHKRKRAASRIAGKGDPAHKSRPPGEGFRYQMGIMVPRFQQSSRYMAQVAKAKRAHLSEVQKLIADSKAIKRTDAKMTELLTIGDMKAVEKIKKVRDAQVKEIKRQHAKTMKAKQKVIAAAADAADGVAGMGTLAGDDSPWYSGLTSWVGANIGNIVTEGVTGVISAETQSMVNQREMEAQQKLIKKQQQFAREQAAAAAAAAAANPSPMQTIMPVVQSALEKPWYQNPMVLLPAAGILGVILWKK